MANGKAALLIGDAQPFDLDVPVLYNTVFDEPVYRELLSAPDAAAARAWLNARHLSHVYVHWGEVDRYRSPGNYGFPSFLTPLELARLELWDVLVAEPPLADHPGSMYRVVEASEEKSAPTTDSRNDRPSTR